MNEDNFTTHNCNGVDSESCIAEQQPYTRRLIKPAHEDMHRQARIYLAGPMTGLPGHNFEAFHDTSAMLRKKGFDVISPAELEAKEIGSDRKTWEYYLRRDLSELVKCDYIGVMEGWEKSAGARLEVMTARALHMDVYCTFGESAGTELNHEEVDRILIRGFSDGKPLKAELAYALGFSLATGTRDAVQQVDEKIEFHPEREHIGYEFDASTIFGGNRFQMMDEASTVVAAPTKESILEEAQRIVGGDRARMYGHPKKDFDRTAAMWSAILGFKVETYQVPLCMIAVKVSRQCNARKRDNLVDIGGYAQTAAMVDEAEGNA